MLAEGKAPLLELETEGALRVKRRTAGAVTIFVTAPVDELERRLRDRATESSGVIEERVDMARHQLSAGGSSTTWSRTTTGSVQQSASRRSSPESSPVPLPWRGNDPPPHR